MVGLILEPAENEGPVVNSQAVSGMTLFPEAPTTTYSPEYAQEKADKLALVLGDASPGTDTLTADISGGYQQKWDQLIKSREDTNVLAQRNEIIRGIASSRDPAQPVNMDDLALVENLSKDELYSANIDTILEKKYADLYTNILTAQEDNHVLHDAMSEDPEGTMDVLDRAQAPMQRSQIAQDILESTKTKYDDTSWGSWGVDMAKSMIPGYTTLKGRERIETPTASLLAGSNREEQISQLYSLPPEEFKSTLNKIIDDLGGDNMVEAMTFASDVASYSSNDKAWGNFGTVADVASAVPLGGAVKVAKGMSIVGKQIVTNPRNIGQIAAAAGLNKVSAIANVSKNIMSGDFTGLTTLKRIDEVADRLPSLFAPKQFLTNGSKFLNAEAQARLEVAITDGADDVLKVLQEGSLTDRLEPTQVAKAATEAYERVTDMFPSNAHKIIDYTVIPAEADRITNTPMMSVRFGRQDGQLFKYEATAKNYADKYIGLKTDDYAVKQDQLGGYYIEVQKPITDTGNFRSLEVDTTIASPDTFNNKFARSLRSPDYLLSQSNVKSRGQVVGTTEYLAHIVDDVTKPFRGKSSEWYKEMDTMFRQTRVQKKNFTSASEFETAFHQKFSKVPSEDQYEAYFRYVQMGDLDYIVRDADKVKRMTAKGLENFDMKVLNKETQTNEVQSITGKVVDRLPLDQKEPFRVKVIQNGEEKFNFPNLMAKWQDRRELVEKLLADGYKIIQHADSPTYTLTKDFKRNSIKMKTLGHIEGGHLEQKYDFFIRQGQVEDLEGAKVLKGDTNLASVPTEAQAREIAKLMDEARIKVKNKDPGAAKWIDENMPFSYDEFIKKVKLKQIDLDTPIVFTAKGQRSSEVMKYESIYGKDFYDYQSSERNLLQDTSAKFTQERSDSLLDVYTTDKSSVFKQEWESVLSPMDALASATRNMINVRVMEDYAIKSTNDWIQEFGHLLDVHPETLRANPRYYINNPPYKSGIGIDKAEAARVSMTSLFGQIDALDAGRNVLKDKVLNKIFDKSGESARSFVDNNWATANDVQTFIRKTTSDLKLGFWNVKQLFLQSSAIASTVAISPRSGLAGGRAWVPTWLALHSGSDDVVRGLYNKFGKVMGWEKNNWMNMVKTMKQSGFANVGGDLSYLDNMSLKSPGQQFAGKIKESPIGQAVGTHREFFKQGELNARVVAWATAYDEWTKLNPGKIPDRFGEGAILARAKTFTQNMTRDSNSQWQKGWASVATQFMSYHMRVAEQLWDGGLGSGKKLTQAEKIRFLGTMSALYGAGNAVSAALPVFPVKDMVRDWLAEAGIDLAEYPIADAVMDGLIAQGVESMTGAEVDFSGYGPSGMPTLYDLMNEDKTWAETMMGAGAGVIGDLIGSGATLANLAYGYGFKDGNVTGDDLLSFARNISTVDNFAKTYVALNTGKYLSRKGTYITDVNQTEAVLQSILGTSPDRVAETFASASALKDMKAARQTGMKEYEDSHRKAIRALVAGDEDSYRIYAKRRDTAKIAYDLTPTEVNQINRRYFNEAPFDENIKNNLEKWNRKYNLFNTEE